MVSFYPPVEFYIVKLFSCSEIFADDLIIPHVLLSHGVWQREATWYILKWIYIYINMIYTIFYHAISGICIWHILWHSIWYIFGDSLWLISGGEHSAPELTVEVQRGTLWSGRGTLWSWASGGGSAGSHSGPELALEVWQEHFDPEGAVGSGGNTAI